MPIFCSQLSKTMAHTWFSVRVNTFPTNVLALVRWATGKRLTNRQPTLSPITLLPWNDQIFRSRPDIRVDLSPTRVSSFWAPRESIFQVRHEEVQLFFKKAYWRWWDSKSRPKSHVLPSTPCVLRVYIKYSGVNICSMEQETDYCYAEVPLALLRSLTPGAWRVLGSYSFMWWLLACSPY